ncbi:MAG: helicase-related protein [Candidatus Helarchaeota archaeon]
MSEDFTLADVLNEGSIIDNRRKFLGNKITLKEVLKKLAQKSEGFKSAVGYFYIEGLSEIIYSMEKLQEIKILMGGETTPRTKTELINAFINNFNQIEENEITIPAIALFHQLVKDAKVLKVKIYFGENKLQRLHSKAYLFIRKTDADVLDKYRAGIIGSSNLTPSGLIGNTELNVIIDNSRDLSYLEKWFDELWETGTEKFEKLRVAEIIVKAIEDSKFGQHLDETFTYCEIDEFFKMLIKYLKAEYLFENWKQSGLFKFQVVDAIRCLRLLNENNYRGLFLTSSVGLGKSYVACKIADIFLREGQRILILAPANLVQSEDQWPRYIKEFNLMGNVDLISMGALQKNPDIVFEKRFINYITGGRIKLDIKNKYGLIIVDEAHNYRNEDAFRTRNLKKIIDLNGNSKILFLTATPINTSLDDLLNLIKLFHRPGFNLRFDKMVRDLSYVIGLITEKEIEELSKAEKKLLIETQEIIEKELFVKSTRETIKTDKEYLRELKEFAGVDLRDIPDPEVFEASYSLHKNYKPIVNGIIDFISNLTAAHLRIIDPERGRRLGGFFKWLLYKRFESSITAYYLTLRRLARKNELIILAIENQDISYLEPEYEDDVDINFNLDFKENIAEIIDKINEKKNAEFLLLFNDLKKDTELIHKEIQKLEPYAISDLRFNNDYKLNKLKIIIENNKNKKILLFTQYYDTLMAIQDYFKNIIEQDNIRFVSSRIQNKYNIIEIFNDVQKNLNLLFSTDTLSEGFNIGGADLVINFDIPYNPVRIIQRIGRATRLDNPKKIEVINFKPDEDIDKELDLIEKMDLRIKDIIKFVGVEYRVWIDRENEIRELLNERRLKDINIYSEVVKSIRNDLISGKFDKLEVKIKYTKPTLALLQKIINKYGLTRKDVDKIKLPRGNYYTTLKGNNNLIIYHEPNDIYNENKINIDNIEPINTSINFHKYYEKELMEFEKYLKLQKKENIILQYYTDSLDRRINNIIDLINKNNLDKIYYNMDLLIENLLMIKDKCGSNTEKIVKKIYTKLRKEKFSNKEIIKWIDDLNNSYTIRTTQQTLIEEPFRRFYIAYLEGERQ